jgi:hypothetical protein
LNQTLYHTRPGTVRPSRAEFFAESLSCEALINEDFCSLARRERFLSAGILKIFRALKNARNAASEQKDH